jgi:hypothetical protein
MKITVTTSADLEQIREWIEADPYHKDDPRCTAEGLLTGNGALTFCLGDDEGPLCFVRLDAEGEFLRLSTQFGPESEVSKKRLIVGLLSTGIPAIVIFAKEGKYKGIIFESKSPSLIKFMEKQGFFPVSHDDYALIFEEQTHV